MSLLQGSNPSPVKPLPYKLTNKKASVFTVPIEQTKNMKAIVVTDQNFGKTLPLTDSLPQFLIHLMKIITREKINCIFIIGDIVNFDDLNVEKAQETLLEVFKQLEMIPLPIYIMGGENNRRLLFELNYNMPFSNIKIVYDFLIRIHNQNTVTDTPQNIYLTHDAKNPLKLKPDEVESYAIELKRAFKDEISNEDFLIIGHCQAYYLNEAARVATIREYSPDNHHEGYAIIEMTEQGLQLKIVGK